MQFCNQHAVIDKDLNSKKKYNSNEIQRNIKTVFKELFLYNY